MPSPTDSESGSKPPAKRVQNGNEQSVSRFVSKVKNLDLQIGEHVLAALQHPNTVAVLTTVVIGPGGEQHIVSAALNPQRMAEVNEILEEAQQERVEDEVCFGFHCLLKPK